MRQADTTTGATDHVTMPSGGNMVWRHAKQAKRYRQILGVKITYPIGDVNFSLCDWQRSVLNQILECPPNA